MCAGSTNWLYMSHQCSSLSQFLSILLIGGTFVVSYMSLVMSGPRFCLSLDIAIEDMGTDGLINLCLIYCEGCFCGDMGDNIGFDLKFWVCCICRILYMCCSLRISYSRCWILVFREVVSFSCKLRK